MVTALIQIDMRHCLRHRFSGSVTLALAGLLFASVDNAASAPANIGSDHNLDGIVSHADYTLIGDNFGDPFAFSGDGNGDGSVDELDYALYQSEYGVTASDPSILPLTVSAAATPSNSVLWTFTFSNVDGALAGHLNISTDGATILSVDGGPSFLDDNIVPLDTPGLLPGNVVAQGLSIVSSTEAFAALGSTLTQSFSNATLGFLTLETQGTGATSLTYSGEYGYQGIDYVVDGTADFTPVPEPSACTLVLLSMASISWLFLRRES